MIPADLRHVLQDAVPEPPRQLRAPQVVNAAVRLRRRRRAALAVCAASVTVAAAVWTWTPVRSSVPAITHVPMRLSALEGNPTLGPVALENLADEGLLLPVRGALVGRTGRDGRDQVWLVAARGDRVCLADVDEGYGAAAVGCANRSDLLTDGLVLLYSPVTDTSQGDASVAAVVAPDGYTRARIGSLSAPVQQNVALLHGQFRLGQHVVLTGPHLPPATIAFGP